MESETNNAEIASASPKRNVETAGLDDGNHHDNDDGSVASDNQGHDDRKTNNNNQGDDADDVIDEEAMEDEDAGSLDGEVEPEVQQLEPSYLNFGELPFSKLVKRLELLWKSRVHKEKLKKGIKIGTKEMLEKLLPPKEMKELLQPQTLGGPPESPFPLLRLICPEKDASRRYAVKEATLANMYIDGLGWTKQRPESRKLIDYHDPHVVGSERSVAGDFSVVLQHVLEGKGINPPIPQVSLTQSKVTIAQINKSLDELAAISNGSGEATNHDWRNNNNNNSRHRGKPKKKELRAQWVKQFLNGGALRLPPVEHKWLARILYEKMQFYLGFETILKWIHPAAPDLWSGHNSLKAVCNAICRPEMSLQIKSQEALNVDQLIRAPYLGGSGADVVLGRTFTPMFSQRTSFQRILTSISDRHRAYVKNPDYTLLNDDRERTTVLNSLAIKHPVFSVETKLDGERMLVHYHREGGMVKVHSRNGVWFSDLYSPILGPAIRQAVGDWDLDLILDGEVIPWDNAKQETVPFGNSRTVAKLRRDYMASQRLLDPRDEGLHAGNTDDRVFGRNEVIINPDELIPDLAGKECWLQFIAFDVVYVGGPKARDFLASTISPFVKHQEPGSIIGLDGLERKKILYRLIKNLGRDQGNEVDIVRTEIVRPNGKKCEGRKYFSHEYPEMECGYPCHALDSITGTFHGFIPDLARIDAQRRGNLSDEEISQARAEAVNCEYATVVENWRLEGLMFKDLATPYVLDKASRLLQYWHKFKPDYFSGAVASDLDLVIIGAYFATGLRHSGRPSSFLCACVDSMDECAWFPVVKVNGASLNTPDLIRLLAKTNFKSATSGRDIEYGSWFRLENRDLPSFVTRRNFNVQENGPLWKPAKKDYPDLWIDPRDSVVVQLNAGEITFSSAFPLALTLRFPRIQKLREDKTDPSQIESETTLWDLFNKVQTERNQDSNSSAPSFALVGDHRSKLGRFLTELQYARHKRDTKKGVRRAVRAVPIAAGPAKAKSRAFVGLEFCVLDGKFGLDSLGVEASDQQQHGWVQAASLVKRKEDIERFIKEHGGTVIINPRSTTLVLGGRKTDIRVDSFVRGLVCVRAQPKPKGKNPTKKLIQAQELSAQKGVLRWTFPFALHAKWESLGLEGTTIKKAAPNLAVPSTLDYLARPLSLSSVLSDELRDLGKLDNVLMLQRALEFVDGLTPVGSGDEANDWRHWCKDARVTLKPEDYWVLSQGTRHFWPDTDSSSGQEMVVFPDVFPDVVAGHADDDDDDCDEEVSPNGVITRWEHVLPDSDSILSVLPLVRMFGATVVDRLDSRVTHLICELSLPDMDIVTDPTQLEPGHFRNAKRGAEILNRLEVVKASSSRSPPNNIWILSPSWVRGSCQKIWSE